MQDPKSSSSRITTITKAGSSSQRSLVLAIVIFAQVMVVVDYTIVQIALPSIGREFGVSVNGLQWIVTTYGLTTIHHRSSTVFSCLVDGRPCAF
jgi:hypothetical protein